MKNNSENTLLDNVGLFIQNSLTQNKRKGFSLKKTNVQTNQKTLAPGSYSLQEPVRGCFSEQFPRISQRSMASISNST